MLMRNIGLITIDWAPCIPQHLQDRSHITLRISVRELRIYSKHQPRVSHLTPDMQASAFPHKMRSCKSGPWVPLFVDEELRCQEVIEVVQISL